MEMSEILVVLMGSSITMMGWSLIYKENVFYRVIEHLIIGLMTGYTAYTTLTILINNILMPLITDGAYLNIVPIIFGLLLLTRLSKDYAWLSRWGIAALGGIGTGVAIKGVVQAQISNQILATALSFTAGDGLTNFNNILVFVGVLTSISYFFFTFGPNTSTGKILLPLGKVGRLFLMATFGAVIGSDVLCNGAFLLERMEYITTVQYAWVPAVIALALIAYDVLKSRASA